ncbi:phospholipase [Desemzia sp. RIT804]|uniref:alpha/beta hydrolase n=1 Tax=Desemzia sp. RIT 804 TaxID=2810209 RepID=UPI00194E0588|nr:phospholipase [Desemzia sp. RIT 804]MBM6614836.1 phospholipase [Desemzia sp. RIT 804]
MKYISIPASAKEFFVLFHGTGGNEYSLLAVTGDIDPNASVISFVGDEGTGENRRFFKPLVDRKLQSDNFNEKVDEFLTLWDSVKPVNAKITFIGYSNGANFILGLLEKRPDIAESIVLLHPSNLDYTFEKRSSSRIFLTVGANDPLSVPGDVMKLAKQLTEQFPATELKMLDTGHEVTPIEVQAAAEYLRLK